MTLVSENPFRELPESLVEEMLSYCGRLSKDLSTTFHEIQDQKKIHREILDYQDLLKNDSQLSIIQNNPTSCGVDGSYAIERLLSTDLVAIAAVAVEGLAPPSERRYWPIPHHICYVFTVPHHNLNQEIAETIMFCMELELAAKAPHDVVMLDGSLTTPIIHLNQTLGRLDTVPTALVSLLENKLKTSLDSLNTILHSEGNKIFVGLPKYTTQQEISRKVLLCGDYEDRGLLSFVLEPGEYVGPIDLQFDKNHWQIEHIPYDLLQIADELIPSVMDLRSIYYRPYQHMPSLRLETAKSIVSDQNRLAKLLESLRIQCSAFNIFEPYPLFLADRMVKHLHTALPAIRKATTQELSIHWNGNLQEIYFAMHGYRTDWG